ncbi:contact-dependent growth inhibition system immunity protein [Paenibacillus sp. 23TSA30-6]|uniref:contact-dependent growth inhibition system immunity protein n=1 Tax=Paenibacillus sp. 23TSA30-6 TaxID=2546104 RepID=UPI001788967A
MLNVFDRTKKLSLFITKEAYEEAVQNAIDNPNSPLVKWYLDILDKTLENLENFDLIRCIRQNIFVEMVVFEIIQRILKDNNPFFAEIDTVELTEKLSSVDHKILEVNKESLIKIISLIIDNDLINKSDIWLYEDEKDEYRTYINKINRKLKVGY